MSNQSGSFDFESSTIIHISRRSRDRRTVKRVVARLEHVSDKRRRRRTNDDNDSRRGRVAWRYRDVASLAIISRTPVYDDSRMFAGFASTVFSRTVRIGVLGPRAPFGRGRRAAAAMRAACLAAITRGATRSHGDIRDSAMSDRRITTV